MNKKFQNIESFAKEIYLQLLKEQESPRDFSVLSQQAYECAEVWFDLQNERLKLFYSHEKNRADWYQDDKIKGCALNTKQHKQYVNNLSSGHYGNRYWVIKHGDDNNTPVYAELYDIDDGYYLFKEVNSNNSQVFKIKSILIEDFLDNE